MAEVNGLGFLNIELTSRCNKRCPMCGRRKMEREFPELCDWGDMPKEMVYEISKQVPKEIVVQFHNNGEPTLFPYLGWALSLFKENIRCFNTNGKRLLEVAGDIIGSCETCTISVVEGDSEQEEQYEITREFILLKRDRKPSMVFRCLGRIENMERWRKLEGIVATRILHRPEGSFGYEKSITIPEVGFCIEIMSHLAIDRYGNISLCVRFDPQGDLRLGNIKEITLEEAWSSEKRRYYIARHIEQRRSELPGCQRCEYWGVPRGE